MNRNCDILLTCRQIFVAAGFSIAAIMPTTAADMSFRAAFDAASGQDVISIAVPDTDTLVFDGGAFYSQGRRINIVATKARATGETWIGFFAPEIRPPTLPGVANTGEAGAAGAGGACSRSGCNGAGGGQGAEGAKGTPGAAAPSLVFDVVKLEGDGRVVLASAGQGGGQGQKGGKGELAAAAATAPKDPAEASRAWIPKLVREMAARVEPVAWEAWAGLGARVATAASSG